MEMELSDQQILWIASLARLQVRPEDLPEYRRRLGALIAYFGKLSELDVTDVEPTSHVLGLHSVLRDDIERPSLAQQKILQNAPEARDGCFVVPRILED